jgi:prolyl 4-hydroxylase
MAIDANGDPLEAPRPIQVLSDNPLVETIGAFLTPEECSYLVDRATPMLQPSIVVHPVTGRAVRDPVRTALSASFPFVLEDPVVHAINRRITAATATRFEQGEPLQVLSYDVGQEYKLHSDTLPAGLNQRTQTFLVTLSAGFAGGATDFPRIPLRFRGQAGDALRFSNVDESGQPDARAWHAGLPVSRGRKLILSKWIRERPLDLSGAPGRSL